MRPESIAFGVAVVAAIFGFKWFRDRRVRSTIPPRKNGREQVSADFASGAAERGAHFFYIKIPGNIQPLERGDLFEDPLIQSLEAAGLGEVTGGGSQLAKGGGVEYCGIDVEVNDRERGLALILSEMRRLNAPQGTLVEEYVPEPRQHHVYGA